MSKDSFEDAAGNARSAVENIKDAISSGADAAASVDYSALRDDIVKLSQTVSDLVQKQTSAARDQVMGAVGSAADNITQSTSVAQDKLASSLEEDMEAGIKKNPWTAIAIAALVGLLVGKMV
jgi:ElaB/YqjD/DUF883 family membrane-anchored ribosome-binding protein